MAQKLVKYFVVDVFTDSAFKGNPAAVCLLEEERDEKWLQDVAAEFNCAQTSYVVRVSESDTNELSNGASNPRFHLRWFTPVTEVQLCGHATLAAAHTLFLTGLVKSDVIEFLTLSGILTAKRVPEVKKRDGSNVQDGEGKEPFLVELNFPAVPTTDFNSGDITSISKTLNGASIIDIKRTTTSDDLFVVLSSGKAVTEIEPHFDEIRKCDGRGLIVSGAGSPESGFDFYSRFFCPKVGINEDPACGSAHCALAPYWAEKLRKRDFMAYVASPRSGILNIHLDVENQRVLLRGKAVAVMEGTLLV